MKRPKLLILGLDGVPYELLLELCQRGAMPNTATLLERGRMVPMTVSIPDLSAVSWTSFMTGTDAGNHGIYGFVDLVPGTYKLRFPDFRDLQCPTLFDALGEKRKRSVVISLPSTYPVRPFPGVLVAGFFALHLEKTVTPLSYLPLLRELRYQVDVDSSKGKTKKMEFLADLHYCLKVKKQLADILWSREDWDLFMFTVTETDRLHHFLFDAWQDPNHPQADEFLHFYQEVDEVIGDFCQKLVAQKKGEVILLSDHGFGPVRREVYLNPLLRRHHFLQPPPTDEKTLEYIGPETKAFALDPARVFINLEGRFPRGGVKKSDCLAVRRDLRQLLESWTEEGDSPVAQVLEREEVYSPRCRERAADLLLLPNPEMDLKAGIEKKEIGSPSGFAGMHRRDNALFFCTRPEWIPEEMTIFAVRDIIERLLTAR